MAKNCGNCALGRIQVSYACDSSLKNQNFASGGWANYSKKITCEGGADVTYDQSEHGKMLGPYVRYTECAACNRKHEVNRSIVCHLNPRPVTKQMTDFCGHWIDEF